MRLRALCAVLVLALGAGPAYAQNWTSLFTESKPAEVKKKRAAAPKPKPPAVKPTAEKPPVAAAMPAAEKQAQKPPVPADDGNTEMSAAERIAIQAALSWAGDYAAAANGESPFVAAVKSFQKRNKSKITGVLAPSERATLLAAAKKHDEEFGWRVIDDPATGARIGLPTKMVPLAREARGGSHWTSKHGDMRVETFKINDADTTLAALFDLHKKEPPSRKIEFSALRTDSFIVSGLQGLKKFAVRAYSKDGEVRGFTILFDQAVEGIVAPVTAAMASTFTPFPAPAMQLAAVTPKKVEYATALVVSANGHLITDRKAAEGCQVIVAAGLGNAERVAEDKTQGIALLRVYGARKLKPAALAGEAPQGSDVTVLGVPDPRAQDGDKVRAVTAKLMTGGAALYLQPAPASGFTGGAVLDRQGRFFGMVENRNAVVASTATAAPQAVVVPVDKIKAFLAAQKIAAIAAPASVEDAKASVLLVICVRK